MKISRILYIPLAAATILSLPQLTFAASSTWDGDSSTLWATGSNWVGDVAPVTTGTAIFNGAGNGNTTIDLGAGQTIGGLLFDTSSAAAYTIGSGGVGSQTLTLGNAGTLTINSGVTTNQTFDANLQLSNAAGATTTITNNGSGLLTLSGTVNANVASGNGRLTVSGSGSTTISGPVTKTGAGANALFKQGAGTLTLTNGSTWNGTGATSGGFSGPMIVQEGVLLLNGGTHAVTGEAVIGGVVTNGGAGQNAKIQIDSGALNISGFLSVGRGNGVGVATSVLELNNAATVTAGNFSAGYNGNNTLNLPKGSITLNNTSSLSINTNGIFNLAESAGSNMTMTLNDSSTVTLNGNNNTRYIGSGGTGVLTLAGSGANFTDLGTGSLIVAQQNGIGTVNVNSGTLNHANGEIIVAGSLSNGTFSGTGTVNVAGGTVNAKALTVGRANSDAASSLNGAVNVSAGTLNVTAGLSLIGWRGVGTTGSLNVSGGTFNQGTTAAFNMDIGAFTGANGAVTVSSGALNLQNSSNLRFASVAGANASARTLTISGGNVTFYSDSGTTVGGTGTIDLMNTANASGTNTINLDGGALTANQIKATSATGTRVINFNSGTLKNAGGNTNALGATFLASGVATTANVRNGGAIIDTNGFNTTIGQALVHSTIGGDNAIDGGLTKLSEGSLTLTATNTYTGNTTISAGTLLVGSAGQLGAGSYAGNISNAGTFNFASSAAQTLSGAISGTGALTKTVGSGVLTLSGSNTYTGNTTISAGTLQLSSQGSMTFALGANEVNNMITGTGFLTLEGTFVFDLSGASIVDGNSWMLVDVGSLFATIYDPSFAVAGFTESSDVWTKVEGNSTWTFTESTGVLDLTVVPEPASIFLVVGGLSFFIISRRRAALV